MSVLSRITSIVGAFLGHSTSSSHEILTPAMEAVKQAQRRRMEANEDLMVSLAKSLEGTIRTDEKDGDKS